MLYVLVAFQSQFVVIYGNLERTRSTEEPHCDRRASSTWIVNKTSERRASLINGQRFRRWSPLIPASWSVGRSGRRIFPYRRYLFVRATARRQQQLLYIILITSPLPRGPCPATSAVGACRSHSSFKHVFFFFYNFCLFINVFLL